MLGSKRKMIENLLTFLPMILIFFLANLAEKKKIQHPSSRFNGLEITSYILVSLIFVFTTIIGLSVHLISLLAGFTPKSLFTQIFGTQLDQSALLLIGMGIWVPSFIALLVLIPIIRRGIAHLVPIDSTRLVHTLSLSLSMLVFIQLFSTIGIGLNTLSQQMITPTLKDLLISLWSQDILLFLIGLIGVGWLTRRNGKEALTRLGIIKPSIAQIILGMVIGICFAGLSLGIEWFANLIGAMNDPHVNELTEKSLGPLFHSTIGILTLGLAAAIGEETIFRGALQPRFGIIYTAILFTFTHANYGFSLSTLVVFILAFALGFLRKRYSTTLTMIVHATYNITLGIIGA
jgi:uncharacterized protein